MGVVYLARDERVGRSIALKVLAPDIAEDAALRARFLREARRVASIEHPNVVQVYDAGEDAAGGDLYLTMRYLPGGDLGSVLRREGRLPEARAVELVSQVGGALAAAHRLGLVHRDVKPGNILLDRDVGEPGRYLLSDFGLSTVTSERSVNSLQGQIVGTLAYMAPEQIRGDEPDPRSDIYSLGCVLYECLTGSPPYEGSESTVMYGHLNTPPPVPSRVAADVGEDMDRVVARAMAKEPSERYQTAAEFVDDLSHGAHAAVGPSPTRIRGRHRAVLVAAVLCALVLGLGLAVRSRDGGRPATAGAATAVPTGRLAFSGVGPGIDVMPAAGGRPRPLTSGAKDYDPQLSPSGRQLVFLRLRNGFGIPTIAAGDGTGARPLLPAGERYQVFGGFFGNDIAWSPGGTRLAFVFGSAKHQPASGIAVVGRSGKGARPVVLDCNVAEVLSRNQYRRCEQTHPLHGDCVFTRAHPYPQGCTPLLYQSPAWSPDGRRIAFAAGTGGKITATLWIVNADGTGLHPIRDGLPATAHQENPSWSPDGRTIAFNACDSQNLCSIYTMTPSGSSVRRLPAGTNVAADPKWGPSGKLIAYLCQFNSIVSICEIRRDGRSRRVVLRGTRKHQPADLTWGW